MATALPTVLALALALCAPPGASRVASALVPSRAEHTRTGRRAFVAAAGAAALPRPARPARALAPDRAATAYDAYAPTYDALDGGGLAASLGIEDARERLIGRASGDVLEVGVGTGLNLGAYRWEGLTSLTVVDVSEGMLAQARGRLERLGRDGRGGAVPVRFVRADATSQLRSLFGAGHFDTVVDSFSLCVMGDDGARRCLDEMAGVVKRPEEGGRILLIENTRASNPLLGYYQDLTASAAAGVGGKGCVYNQDVGALIRRAPDLRLVREEAFAAGLFRAFTCEAAPSPGG